MLVNQMGWRRGRTAFASSDHLVSREGSYHATVNGTCSSFGLKQVKWFMSSASTLSDCSQPHRPRSTWCAHTSTNRQREQHRQPSFEIVRPCPGGRTRNGKAMTGAGKLGAGTGKVGRVTIRVRGAGRDKRSRRRARAGRDKRLRWAGRLVMALLSLSPMTSGSRKARRGRKRKERRRKEATAGNPGSIAKKVAVTRIGSML